MTVKTIENKRPDAFTRLWNLKETELERAIRRRRTLHQIPEIELDLPDTARFLKQELKHTSAEIIEPEGIGSGFLAYFDAGKEDTLAFRADMDALPVTETSGVSFESRHPGRMHACGHDGHMTNLLALADRIEENKEELPANILLIFQAGEETPGGARLITEQGWLQKLNVRSVYGLHLWPMIPKGSIALRPIEMMARSCEVRVRITGHSVHAARYQEGIDAMETGCEFLRRVYELEKSLPGKEFRLIRFGKMWSGSVLNAVAGECHLEGSLRAFLDPVFDYLYNGILMIAEKLEEETGAKIEVTYSSGYPAVLNDEALAEEMFERNPGLIRPEKPEMISEDFAFYQKEVPGLFFFLGTGTGIPLHASSFDFDESILLSGADLFEDLALHPLPSALQKTGLK